MSIYKASDSPYASIEWIPTGFANLDKILGGGAPTRKVLECSGQFSVGKSTLALHIVSEAQKLGKDVLWADSEFSWSEDYAKKLGVDTSSLDVLTGRYAEEILDEIEQWADEHKNSVIVLDSVGGLLPRAESEKGADGKVIGGQAKLIATFCRKIIPIIAMNNISLIMLNHNFTDLMTGKLKTSGGAKLEYAKSIWLMLRKANKRMMKGEIQVGDIIEAEIRKNKLAATLKQTTELSLVYGEGFSKSASLEEEAKEKLFEKKGQFYWWDGVRIARGDNGLRELFKDETFAAKIKDALHERNEATT